MTIYRKFHPVLSAGLIIFALSQLLKHTLQSAASDNLSSFLSGIAVVVMIAGVVMYRRCPDLPANRRD